MTGGFCGRMLLAAAGALAWTAGAKDFNVRDYGGNVPAAAEAAAKAGGGRVVVPAGEWTSGTIWLKDHVELHLEKGAVIKGSLNKDDYNRDGEIPENWRSEGEEWSGAHLVFAVRAKDVAITGEGTIDGNGPAFFGPCDEIGRFPWYKYGLKLKPLDREWFRPGFMVTFLMCRDVRVEGVTLRHTPCWTAHFRCCDGVLVKGVRVEADRTIANSDGVSFDCTRNATLRDSTLLTGDDSVTVRASCHLHAATNACENVLVENCDLSSCCFGVRIGVGTGTIRNVTVRNCRVHEAAEGIGFTPAFSRSARNVHISDVLVENCTVREADKPLSIRTYGGDLVKNVVVRNCDFAGMSPSYIGGHAESPVENVTFENCRHTFLQRLKVRHDLDWEKRLGVRHREFLATNANCRAVRTVNCLPEEAGARGVLLLTFDDRNFADWERAMPLFAKYGAHATFFVSGAIDNKAVKSLKKLSGAGHTVGLHGLKHLDADIEAARVGMEKYYRADVMPQQDRIYWAYLPCSSFAYPNTRRTDETDDFLFGHFTRLRAGVPGAAPYDPKGEKQKDRRPLVTNEGVFFPAADLPNRRLIRGFILGEAYHTDIDEVLSCVRRAAERKEVICLISHGISPDAQHIHMKTAWLEAILACAKESGIAALGYDELPAPAPAKNATCK